MCIYIYILYVYTVAVFFLLVTLVTTQLSCHTIICIYTWISSHDVTANHVKQNLDMYINHHISFFFMATQLDRKVNTFQLR